MGSPISTPIGIAQLSYKLPGSEKRTEGKSEDIACLTTRQLFLIGQPGPLVAKTTRQILGQALRGIYQLPGVNALDVANRVRTFMEEAKRSFPLGLEYEVSYDNTLFVLQFDTNQVSMV